MVGALFLYNVWQMLKKGQKEMIKYSHTSKYSTSNHVFHCLVEVGIKPCY